MADNNAVAKSFTVYVLLVLTPVVGLAVFSWRVADQDYEQQLRRDAVRLHEEADALRRRIESAVGDAAQVADRVLAAIGDRINAGTDDFRGIAVVVGFADDGGFMGYTPRSMVTEPNDDGTRLYNLSVQGGESYEFVRGDPERAVDAYAFYLSKIQDTELRDRLRFFMSRAAFSYGNSALGRALLQQLFASDSGSLTEDGYPIDILAAARLVTLGEDSEEFASGGRRRLLGRRHRVSTPHLKRLVRELAPDDPDIARVLGDRRALEGTLARHPEILAERNAVLMQDALLRARPLEVPSLRAVCRIPVTLPPLVASGFRVRIDFGATVPSREVDNDPEVLLTRRTVRLDSDTPLLATLEVSAPDYGTTLERLEERRMLHRVLVALLIVLILGGGGALVFYHARQWRLARLQARLLANVSHEMKAPITSIRIFSELLAQSPFEEKRTERFGRLLSSESLRLSRVVDNVLDFSRPGDRRLSLGVEPVDVNALIGRVVEGFIYRARENDVQFHVSVERPQGGDSSEFHVVTNEAAVERILANLLDNALKYRRNQDSRVHLHVIEGASRVRFNVVDNGVGIPQADRERIFEEFYRVRHHNYGVEGSGLGLAIAQRLARGLGGEITVESTEREGSTFSLGLPRSDGDGDPSAPEEPGVSSARVPGRTGGE